jgi:REP element-mobilizing transposase RayT
MLCLSIADTPFYHVISRCVRRAFLCGNNRANGRSYEQRRGWIEERIRLLASVFSLNVAAYAVMSNHYHLVVKLSPAELRRVDEYAARFRAQLGDLSWFMKCLSQPIA